MHKLLNNINGWNQSGPAGNDKQMDPATLLSLASVASNLYGAYQANRQPTTKPISPDEIKTSMQPAQDVITQMQSGYSQAQNLGKDLMNPLSVANQQQFAQLGSQGMNQMALQNILNRRQAAATGTDSGILQAQQREQQRRLQSSLQNQYGGMMTQNRAQGIGVLGQSQGLLGNIFQGQMGIQENIAQSMIAQRQAQMDREQAGRQASGDLFGGMGEGFMNLAGLFVE